MKKTLIYFFAALLILSSCSSSYVSGYSAEPNISINYNIDANLDIDKSKPLQATSTTKVILGFIKIADKNFSDAFPKTGYVGAQEKMAATYKALNGTGYDVLVNPKYMITKKRGIFVSKISATVVGYGAKVKL
tara:strand:+ start:46 stop:444 length:399 start_codon:yes stop_codon:yes gene_type:complete